LDVHARSVVAHALDTITGEILRARLCPDPVEVTRWVKGLPGPAAVIYEAGPTGYGLARVLGSEQIRTVVAAPSKLQRPAGDRVKTDAHDAEHLATLLRLDAFTAVTVPDEATEAARDLVRAREDCRADLMRARHRLSKLLLRHGIVYSGGKAWTGTHQAWLRRQRFDSLLTQAAFDEAYDTVASITARRDRLEQRINVLAGDSQYTAVVRRLGCLRGISTLTGLGLAVASLIRSAEGSSAAVNVILLPMAFLSGSFGPTRRYPEVLRAIGDALPLRYFIKLVNGVYLDDRAPWHYGTAAGVLAAWGVAGLVVAARRFSWEPRSA